MDVCTITIVDNIIYDEQKDYNYLHLKTEFFN